MINYLKALRRYTYEKDYFKRLNELNVVNTGNDSGHIYIQLKSGLKFFGYPSDKVQLKQFNILAPKRLKKQISPEFFGIALDIAKRYLPHKSIEEARIKSRFLNITTGDVVIEGGAFTGYYAMQLSSMVGNNGLVVAIEAAPENFKILKKNIESNNLNNVVAINKALSNQVGELTFRRNKKQLGSLIQGIVKEKEYIKIQGDLIDNIVKDLDLKKVNFIRLQLNGAELNALKGMQNTFKFKPQMLIAAPYSKDGIPFRTKINEYLKKKGITFANIKSNVCINIDDNFVSKKNI